MTTFCQDETFLPEQFRGFEHRTEPRVAVDVPARFKSLSPLMSTGPSIRANIVDLSRSGMKLRVSRGYELGELVQVVVPETFYMGIVRHCVPVSTGFEVGIKLTERIPSSLV